jgi:uncharacterized membrane protein
MGISAGLGNSTPTKLLRRGLLLILLEFSIIDWSWTFNPFWPRKFWQVIAALGVGLIVLGVLMRSGRRLCGVVGVSILLLHNLADGLRFEPTSWQHYAWSFLHQKNVLPLVGGFEVRTTYPVLPIAGLALCGFSIAPWLRDAAGRRKLWLGGLSAIGLFLLLRVSNLYGDSSRFTATHDWVYTLQSLGNVTKYPLSLQFVLMTGGPALLLLGWLSGRSLPSWTQCVQDLGRTPLFFYIAHLYLLHLLALLWALLAGLPPADFRVRFGGMPEDFQFPLWQCIPFAMLTSLLLWPLCRLYARSAARG